MNRSLFQGNVRSSRHNSCGEYSLQYIEPLHNFKETLSGSFDGNEKGNARPCV